MSGKQELKPSSSNDSESPEAKRAKEEDSKYENPVCVCENEEPEPQSEYDVAGDWVTYVGPINPDIYKAASAKALAELEAEVKEYYAKQQATAPRGSAPPVTSSPQSAYDPACPTDASPEPDNQADDGWNDPLVEMYVRDAAKKAQPTVGAGAAAAAGPDACVLGENSAEFAVTQLESESNRDGEATTESSDVSAEAARATTAETGDAEAPQENLGVVAQAEDTAEERQAASETSFTDEVLNE